MTVESAICLLVVGTPAMFWAGWIFGAARARAQVLGEWAKADADRNLRAAALEERRRSDMVHARLQAIYGEQQP